MAPLIEALLLIALPTWLVTRSPWLFQRRLGVLAAIFAAALLLALWHGIPDERLGFVAISVSSLLWYLFMAAGYLVLLALANRVFVKRDQRLPSAIFTTALALAFAQEFIFNAYLLDRFRESASVTTAIFLTAIFFAVMHQIMDRGAQSFILSFAAGFLLALTFAAVPNIWLATAAHAVANVQALRYRLPGIGPALSKLRAG